MVAAFITLVASTFVSVATGFFVYARNPRNAVNRIYGMLTLDLLLAIANYFSLGMKTGCITSKAVIFSSSILAACLYYLVIFMGSKAVRLSRLQQAAAYFTVVVAALDLT